MERHGSHVQWLFRRRCCNVTAISALDVRSVDSSLSFFMQFISISPSSRGLFWPSCFDSSCSFIFEDPTGIEGQFQSHWLSHAFEIGAHLAANIFDRVSRNQSFDGLLNRLLRFCPVMLYVLAETMGLQSF